MNHLKATHSTCGSGDRLRQPGYARADLALDLGRMHDDALRVAASFSQHVTPAGNPRHVIVVFPGVVRLQWNTVVTCMASSLVESRFIIARINSN